MTRQNAFFFIVSRNKYKSLYYNDNNEFPKKSFQAGVGDFYSSLTPSPASTSH